jgi:protein lysine acetyltransferase
MRAILDRFDADWHRDDLGVVTTVVDVPSPRSVRLPASLVKKIRAVTSQVIKAVG